MDSPTAAYVHVPFCAHHCGYCDFAVAAGQDYLAELYLDALQMEMAGEPAPATTIFIGGGTPTHLNPAQLRRLLSIIRKRFPNPVEEFSIESTPESITEAKLEVLREFGLTRLSMGVQSFRDSTLNALDRRHSAKEAYAALEMAARFGLECSLDMMFAAPGQTLDDWLNDLEAAIRAGTGHISTYGLTYEKGTPLWKRRKSGAVEEVGEEIELQMYEASIDALTAAGFEHYEISNYAKPGKRCRHNENYWANNAYYGFGVGAARYLNGVRSTNTRDTRLYIRKILAGEPATFQTEELDPFDRACETLAVQLRRAEGIQFEHFAKQTGHDARDLAGDEIDNLARLGLLEADTASMRLTRLGKCLGDEVVARLMAAAAKPKRRG
jgi:oxygen-independent coproporphyrinogen-3 oxidase